MTMKKDLSVRIMYKVEKSHVICKNNFNNNIKYKKYN